MCRISGWVNFDFPLAKNAMMVQDAGGPDDSEYDIHDNVIFTHNLLSVIGNQLQPVMNERYMLTFNGCWYDYKDYYPYETSDTVALLHHFYKRGLKAVDDVNGMFSIGLHDMKTNTIELFVDRFGQKPLYYYHEKGKFAFASSPAALFKIKDKWEINREALQTYWMLGGTMFEDHLFKGIKKLCASEHLTYDIDADEISISKYYDIKYQDNTSGIEDLVLDAIDKVKVSDVPIHIFLSGGIDSTLVASRFSNGQAIHLDSPEYGYAQQVAKKFNIDLKRIYPQDIEVEKTLIDFAKNSGEPCMAAMIPYAACKETAKYGKVAITANGADELFFGYDRTGEVCNEKQLNHIFRCSYTATKFSVDKSISSQMFELMTYVQFDLNKTLDFAAACNGLEVRSPFLDHRLVEMALSIREKEHRVKGNKSILKAMLKRIGFDDAFLNRPKIGFSIHKQPVNLDAEIKRAWYWVQTEGFLKVDEKALNGRDRRYLEMSALSFYYWHKTFENIIVSS